MRLKTGDTVKVITGSRNDKGTVAEIVKVFPDKNQVIVEGVNLKQKHLKPSQINPDGGIVEKEMPQLKSSAKLYAFSIALPTAFGVRIYLDEPIFSNTALS